MDFVFFDTETHLIKPGLTAPQLVCVSTVDSVKAGLLDRAHGRTYMHSMLKDPKMIIVGHNVFYDLGILCAEDPALFVPLVFKAFDDFRVRDTIVRQQLIDIACGNLKYRYDEASEVYVKTGYTLADLVQRLLDRVLPKEDTWRLKYALLTDVPIRDWPPEASKYAIDDALATRDVFWAQAQMAGQTDDHPEGEIPTEERATRDAWALHLMSMWGIRTDGNAVDALRLKLEAEQVEANRKLQGTGIIKPKKDGTWSRDMKEIYRRVEAGYKAQGLAPPETPSGRVGTDLEALVGCQDPEIQILAEASKGAKLLNTYVPVLEGGTVSPICARFNVLVESNRTSCSSPNCFDGETQVLTKAGWVKFPDLLEGVEVAQWKDGAIEFVQPTGYIKQHSDKVIRISGERNIDLVVTEDHRCLLKHRKTGEYRVFKASEYPEDWQQLHGGMYDGPGMDITDAELRLVIATQADGSYHDNGIEFSFRKTRKIERMETLLLEAGAEFSCRPPTERKVETRFRILKGATALKIREILGEDKKFGVWILTLSRRQMDIFVEEIFHWDGLFTRKSNWASKFESNADWVQAALTLSGMRGRKRVYVNAIGSVSHQVDLRRFDYSMTTNRILEKWPDQTVYCVTVPSSFLLVRRGRTTAVTGNCQNPPRAGGARECFVARPGYVFCSSDYDTIELRSLAQSCLDLVGHSHMAVLLRQDVDLHLALAAQMLDIPVDECIARYKDGDKEVSETRQLAKPGNFGFPGGMSADSFVEYCKGYGLAISRERAHEIHTNWKSLFPEMGPYFAHVSNIVGRAGEGTVISPRSGFVRGGLGFCQLANHYFQSLTATGAKDALWHVTRECYTDKASPLWGSRPVIFMHDEIITEIPEVSMHAGATRQAEIMIEVMSSWIPDVPIKASPTLFRRWYKGAKPVYVDGRLVPSKPVDVGGKTKWEADL